MVAVTGSRGVGGGSYLAVDAGRVGLSFSGHIDSDDFTRRRAMRRGV